MSESKKTVSCCGTKQKKNRNIISILEHSSIFLTIVLITGIFYLTMSLALEKNNFSDALTKFIDSKNQYWGHWFWLSLTSFYVLILSEEYIKAYLNLFKGKIGMHILLGFAVHVLWIYSIVMVALGNNYGTYWEAVIMLMGFTSIGHILEHKLEDQALKDFNELNYSTERTLVVKTASGQVSKNASELEIGDVVIYNQGDRVIVDGTAVQESVFETSSITGESLPRNKDKDGKVLSGYICESKITYVKTTHSLKESTYTKLIDRVNQIINSKPKIQRLADRIAKIFVPTIFLIGIGTFIVWAVLTANGNVNTKLGWFENGMKASMTVVAVACPCAFGIVTPLVLSITTSEMFRSKIIVRNAKLLERKRKISIIALDKTGTITTGELSIHSYTGEERFKPVIKSLEMYSSHPIAKALILQLASEEELEVKDFVETIGKGLSGTINSNKYELCADNSDNETANSTTIQLIENGVSVVKIELADTLKRNAKHTISELRNEGYEVHMITGDKSGPANMIAKSVGIDNVHHSVKPNEKQKLIQELKQKGDVLYCGDGMNDIAAMQEANLSMSYDSGNELISSNADIISATKSMSSIRKSLTISMMSRKAILALFAWAILFNVVMIPIAALMLIDPWVSGIAMSSSDVLLFAIALIYKAKLRRQLKQK